MQREWLGQLNWNTKSFKENWKERKIIHPDNVAKPPDSPPMRRLCQLLTGCRHLTKTGSWNILQLSLLAVVLCSGNLAPLNRQCNFELLQHHMSCHKRCVDDWPHCAHVWSSGNVGLAMRKTSLTLKIKSLWIPVQDSSYQCPNPRGFHNIHEERRLSNGQGLLLTRFWRSNEHGWTSGGIERANSSLVEGSLQRYKGRAQWSTCEWLEAAVGRAKHILIRHRPDRLIYISALALIPIWTNVLQVFGFLLYTFLVDTIDNSIHSCLVIVTDTTELGITFASS